MSLDTQVTSMAVLIRNVLVLVLVLVLPPSLIFIRVKEGDPPPSSLPPSSSSSSSTSFSEWASIQTSKPGRETKPRTGKEVISIQGGRGREGGRTGTPVGDGLGEEGGREEGSRWMTEVPSKAR